MEQIHGHEVLHMMEGNVYSEASLRKAIIDKFGANQLFYTCSASNLTVRRSYRVSERAWQV